jgi:sugar O-acyltransferase (sialic acid O-acetyltransferase NeuD family)
VRVVIVGSRPDGHAKVLAETVDDLPDLLVVGLVDDVPENAERSVRGLRVVGNRDDLLELRRSGVEGVLLGFGDASARGTVVDAARVAGLSLPIVVARSAIVSESSELSEGCQVLACAYVGPDAMLGAGVLVNSAAVVEHDCRIGAGTVVGPGVVLSGRVHLGAGAEVGAGATVLPDRVIGDGARVGAGAVVTRDVTDGSIVVGVPARPH